MTLRAVMGLSAGDKPWWSGWPGQQAVLEGWVMLNSRAWACEMVHPYRLLGLGGLLRLGFVFSWCCATSYASCLLCCYPTATDSLVMCLHPPISHFTGESRAKWHIHSWADCWLMCRHRDGWDWQQSFLFSPPHLGAVTRLVAHLP